MQIIQRDNAVEIISSTGNEIYKVEIFNMQGSLIYSWKGGGRRSIIVGNRYPGSSVYIFKVNNISYKKLMHL